MDPPFFYEKTNNPYSSGTPDVYYEGDGPAAMAWIEYKYRPTKPKELKWELALEQCTALQQRWLLRALENQKKVGIITGFEDPKRICFSRPGYFIFSGTAWEIAQEIKRYVRTG